jgi:DNA-binding GntR family transcriptional regulator
MAKEQTSARPGKGESAEFAYQVLRREIISLVLPPGSDFDEAEVVQRLGISRTPLREAVVRLAGEGLIRLLPNRGARVAPMEWDDIREHLEAFDLAQRLVSRWAAARRSDKDLVEIRRLCLAFRKAAENQDAEAMADSNWEFHAAIAKGSKNARIERFYLQQLTENLRISRLAMVHAYYSSRHAYESHLKRILEEHDALVEAIAEQDSDAADKLAQSHTGLARKRVVEVLTQSVSKPMQMSLDGTEYRMEPQDV